MLNPRLKLNEKIFQKDAEMAATREGYGLALVELGKNNPNVVVLTADLNESTKANKFSELYPDRFFDCGVAEQNMAAIAAGMGISGKVPFISSYATFSPGKNWETIRTTIVYNNSNVKIAGHHSGVVTGPDGATHQATEDIAITRCWPNMTVIVPCDVNEAKRATIAAAAINGPVYLRFTRDKTPLITTETTPFEVGKIYEYWQTDAPQVLILATGHLLSGAILAAKELEEEGVNSIVANIATIKPLDEQGLLPLVKKCQAVVTVEDHQVAGGLGGAVAEYTAKNFPSPIEFVGLLDTFAESGKTAELLSKYKMDKGAIKEAVKRVISRKVSK